MKKIKILDCTLRDGGYYNNWDFPKDLVDNYLGAMSKIGVDYVELGFRSFEKKGFRGPNWYTTENYLNNLVIPKNINVSVMVNASELISHSLGHLKATKLMFVSRKKSKIKLVRLACHFQEFEKTTKICELLKSMGYLVAINLMQISEQSKEKILSVAKIAQEIKPNILYFADSLGGMATSTISDLVETFRTHWQGNLGIHTHNNLGRAVENSLAAMNLGVSFIDSTVTGMGRGPGNAQTEYLLVDIQNARQKKLNILPLLKLINKYFEPLKKKYRWGTNTYYYLAGKYGIHPTYIQRMLVGNFDEDEILATIEQLKNGEGRRYNVELVRSDFQKPMKLKEGSWSPSSKIKNREVLILASGPKSKDYKNELENYIKNKKPFVIALNSTVNVNSQFVDVFAACHPLRLIADAELYKSLKSPLVVPIILLSQNLKKKFKKLKLLNFGIGIKENNFEFRKKGAVVPRLYALAYALSIATSGNASKILLAGFDGFGPYDRRTKTIDELISLYVSCKNSKPLLAVTPTTYNVPSKSIYAL